MLLKSRFFFKDLFGSINTRQYLILTLLYGISIVNAYSQNIQVSGVVVSKSDSASLEFAHIYIKNTSIGTYTNTAGKFILNYPDSLSSDTLVASRVGYRNFYLPLLDQNDLDTINVYLLESDNILDEVVVYARMDTVSAIMKKAFKSLRKNYPTRLHYLEGFYRELSTKGNHYTRLIEASVGVTENGYQKSQTTSKVKIRQIRKSEDYREYSLNRKLYEASFKKMTKLAWGKSYLHHNNIFRVLNSNFIKNDRGKIRNWLEKYDFEILKVIKDNNNLYYHIKFQRPPESSSANAYFGGEMVINMDDYAITEWSFGMIPHPFKKHRNHDSFFYKGKYHRQFYSIYSKIDDKYYPTYCELFEPAMDGTVMQIDKESGKKEFQYNKITFMVNKVVTRKRDFDRIRKKEALEDDLDLYDVNHPYDPEFWANYNILLMDPLLKPAKEDLEKEKSLEKQFKGNGK